MTDEELRVRAIQELEFYKKDDTFMLADITVDLAIEALEQMPVTTTAGEGVVIYYPQVEGVTPTVIKQELCEDAISRDMALEKMADYVSSGYADSAKDFEEYSKIICQLPSVNPQESKWIPIKTRPLTDKEKEEYAYLGYSEDSINFMYDCPLPEDGEEVLITTRYDEVKTDTFYRDEGCYFETYCDEDDVKAWMPLPKPYEPQESEEE